MRIYLFSLKVTLTLTLIVNMAFATEEKCFPKIAPLFSSIGHPLAFTLNFPKNLISRLDIRQKFSDDANTHILIKSDELFSLFLSKFHLSPNERRNALLRVTAALAIKVSEGDEDWKRFFHLYFAHFSSLRKYRKIVDKEIHLLPFEKWRQFTSSWKQHFRSNSEDFPRLIHGIGLLLYDKRTFRNFLDTCLTINTLYSDKKLGAPEHLFVSLIEQGRQTVLAKKFDISNNFYAALLGIFTDFEFQLEQ